MIRELDVWLFDDHVGTLTVVEGRLSFCYRLEWLARAGAVALSCSLPLQAEAFDDRSARPFFAGLLPEGDMRRLIARQYHVSPRNDFELLDRIGGECAGAVSLFKSGQHVPKMTQADDIEWLTDEGILALLEELPRRPMLAGADGLRLSLAGAQDKLPVVVEGQNIGLPRNGTPSSHILKPAIRFVEDSVINEGFCLMLAEALKLKAARACIRRIGTHSFLLVERYDRIRDAQGTRQRLHQEDFCQALGVVPELKYQNEGGPDMQQCFELVRRVTRPSAPQVLGLLDYVLFNVLIANHDAHAKNFSFLYVNSAPSLAPLYDVLSTAIYPHLTRKMAMKLGSKYAFEDLQMRHWDQFAQQTGLSKAQTHKRILEMAEKLPIAARKLHASSNNGFAEHPVTCKITNLIDQRAHLVRRQVHAALSN